LHSEHTRERKVFVSKVMTIEHTESFVQTPFSHFDECVVVVEETGVIGLLLIYLGIYSCDGVGYCTCR